MNNDAKVLFVDDEQNILDTYRVSLRKRFKVDTALGPEEGLDKIGQAGDFGVVVSDLKMPGMDGITFLKKVREVSPDTVRIILTGHGGLDSAIAAVNEGAVFRFLTKPTPLDEIIRTLTAAIEQYKLVIAERVLLRGTLRGSIKVLTDILGLVNPEAFGRSERVHRLAGYVGKRVGLKQPLYLELAAMLCQLGCVTLDDTVIRKVYEGEELSGDEKQAYEMHPYLTAGILSQIPRMGRVSEIIQHQQESMEDNPRQPIESRILKACLDYDTLFQHGHDKQQAIDILRERKGLYDPKIIDILEIGTAGVDGFVRREVNIEEMEAGMILDEGLWSVDGVYLIAQGMEVTKTVLMRIDNFMRAKRLPPRALVLVPVESLEETGKEPLAYVR